MEKRINIALVIFICVAVIFGTWKKKAYFEYSDKGITPPQDTFCLYDQIESVMAGIISIWGGITLIYKSSAIAKSSGKIDLKARIFTICCGLILFLLGILSFWNIYISNSPNCGP